MVGSSFKLYGNRSIYLFLYFFWCVSCPQAGMAVALDLKGFAVTSVNSSLSEHSIVYEDRSRKNTVALPVFYNGCQKSVSDGSACNTPNVAIKFDGFVKDNIPARAGEIGIYMPRDRSDAAIDRRSISEVLQPSVNLGFFDTYLGTAVGVGADISLVSDFKTLSSDCVGSVSCGKSFPDKKQGHDRNNSTSYSNTIGVIRESGDSFCGTSNRLLGFKVFSCGSKRLNLYPINRFSVAGILIPIFILLILGRFAIYRADIIQDRYGDAAGDIAAIVFCSLVAVIFICLLFLGIDFGSYRISS